jgi:hypothetical protein
MINTTKGTAMNTTQINYFTKLSQIEEIIGQRTVFHGSCVVNCPNYEMKDGNLTLAGRVQRTHSGRFQIINGTIWYAKANKKKFFQLAATDEASIGTYLEAVIVSKVGA